MIIAALRKKIKERRENGTSIFKPGLILGNIIKNKKSNSEDSHQSSKIILKNKYEKEVEHPGEHPDENPKGRKVQHKKGKGDEGSRKLIKIIE